MDGTGAESSKASGIRHRQKRRVGEDPFEDQTFIAFIVFAAVLLIVGFSAAGIIYCLKQKRQQAAHAAYLKKMAKYDIRYNTVDARYYHY